MYLNQREHKKLIVRLLSIFFCVVAVFGLLYFCSGYVPDNGLRFAGVKASFIECFYFSVVTVTTLGYGDITPVGIARVVASLEAIFGLIYAGYAISQVVSFKQEALIHYLANDRIIQTYDLCLAEIADAKEIIGDRRRAILARHPINTEEYFYYRLNPFYPGFKAMRVLIGYTSHIESIGKTDEMSERIERAAHHVEEMAGFTKKLVNILISEKAPWKTDRTVMILNELCETIDTFAARFIKYTRYAKQQYKGGGMYIDVVSHITQDIKLKLKGETLKYRSGKSKAVVHSVHDQATVPK